jgi:integrase
MQIANNNNNVYSFNNNIIKGKRENEDGLYTSFIYSIRSEVTRQIYLRCLKYYMKFLGIENLRELVEGKPQKIIEADIKAYLVYLRKQKKVSYNTKSLYLAAIRKFYYVNSDYQFKWNLITMYLGSDDDDTIQEDYYNNKHPTIKYADDDDDDENEAEDDDRPYTMDEIRKMFNAAQDIRVKIIISLLSSSGLRHGAVNILKLRDLEKIEKYNIYKITAYRKSKKYKYITFCTPECTSLVDSYLLYRKNQGEQLKDNSPLIREQFNTNDKLKINNSRHLTSNSIRIMINDVLTKYTNLRRKLSFDYENRRKEGKNPTMLTHGFRKFFNTECAKAGVYPDFIEMMLGHKLPGMRSHYMKPDINTLLEGTKEVKGYIAVIDGLTINEENRLTKQVQELKEKDDYQKYVIDKKIKEKDEEIVKMRQAMRTVLDTVDEMRNDFIAKQNEKVEKDKEIKDHFRKVEYRLFETQMLALKLDEVDQKRQEVYAKKGFITKEDEEAIKNSIIEDVKQNDPGLWHMLFEKQQQQQ